MSSMSSGEMAWADVQDSFDSQEQQLGCPGEGLSQISQTSYPEPSQLFAATPDSLEGGSQPMMRQRPGLATLEESAPEVGAISIDVPTSPRVQPSMPPEGIVPTDAFRSCWSVHGLLKPASAIAAAASPVRGRNGRQKQKRASQPVASPLIKRHRSVASEEVASASESPSRQFDDEVRVAATGSGNAGHGRSQRTAPPVMPGAAEDDHNMDHDRRLQKKTTAVAAIKRSQEYQIYSKLRSAGVMTDPAPTTPDPTSKVSKREWEKSVMEWRKLLRTVSEKVEEVHI